MLSFEKFCSFTQEATIFTDKRFGIDSNFSLFSSFSCSSNAVESNLTSCLLSHTCGRRCSTFYGISCYGNTPHLLHKQVLLMCVLMTESNFDGCTEGTARLANSTIENEGRIEVCHQGTWGPICGAGVVEAYIACKQLIGFDAGMAILILPVYTVCLLTHCVLCILHHIICSSTTTLLQLRVW